MGDGGMTRKGEQHRPAGRGLVDRGDMDRLYRMINNMVSADDSLLDITISQRGIVFTPYPSPSTTKRVQEAVASLVVPVTVGAKVIPDGGSFGDPNNRWECEVFADGVEEVKTDDSEVLIFDIDPTAVFAAGEEPTFLALFVSDDAGGHYEGGTALWRCV